MKIKFVIFILVFFLATFIPNIGLGSAEQEREATQEGMGPTEEIISSASSNRAKKPCGKLLAWLRRPRFTTRTLFGVTTLVAVGLGVVYPSFIKDHLKMLSARSSVEAFSDDRGKTPAIAENSSNLDKKIAEIVPLLRTKRGSEFSATLLYYYFDRDTQFREKFMTKLGTIEQALKSLSDSSGNYVVSPSMQKKRDVFDGLVYQALQKILKTEKFDWTGISFDQASELFEQFGKIGSGMQTLQLIKDNKFDGSLDEYWSISRPLGQVIIEKIRQGELEPDLAQHIYERIRKKQSSEYSFTDKDGGKSSTYIPDFWDEFSYLFGESALKDQDSFFLAVNSLDSEKPNSINSYVRSATHKALMQALIGGTVFESSTWKKKLLELE